MQQVLHPDSIEVGLDLRDPRPRGEGLHEGDKAASHASEKRGDGHEREKRQGDPITPDLISLLVLSYLKVTSHSIPMSTTKAVKPIRIPITMGSSQHSASRRLYSFFDLTEFVSLFKMESFTS